MNQQRRVIALGFFDGVHLGHAALLHRVRRRSRELNATAAALSFDVHPSALLSGHSVPLLNTPKDRVWLLREHWGMDEVILAHFDEKMRHQSWDSFVTDYLAGELHAVHVVAGCDYRFGAKGIGDAQKLRKKCAELGIGCDIEGMVYLDGQEVHSTLIRELLLSGRMEEARRFLGHPHLLSGRVVQGKGLGHTLGFPTVNLPFPEGVLVPAHGVYAAKVWVGNTSHIAAVNIGVRPTVEQAGQVNLEAFLLDFQGDLYDQPLRVELYHFIRGEKRFESVEALTSEVLRNAEQVREYFAQLRE